MINETCTIVFIAVISIVIIALFCIYMKNNSKGQRAKLYVNYHVTRQCNYQCGFCFHTAKTSHVLKLNEAKRGLKLLADYGLKKINFAGGEPFLQKRLIGELLKYCKQTLQIEICSVVSNGSIIHNNPRWFEKYGQYLDILAISCDSFQDDVNQTIGRFNKAKPKQTEIVYRCAELCTKYKIAFKLNTVVNAFNFDEDMVHHIQKLNPVRWKVFQCLLLDGENNGANPDELRDARKFVVSKQQFAAFVERHKSIKVLVAEDNETMKDSYLILDEYLRFLSHSKRNASKSILDVGVENALKETYFDEESFVRRDGDYKRTKLSNSNTSDNHHCNNTDLEW